MSNPPTIDIVRKTLKRRYRTDLTFKLFGAASLAFGILCLVILFTDIVGKGYPAFQLTFIKVDVELGTEKLGITDTSDSKQLRRADYDSVIKAALREQFSDVKGRSAKRDLYKLVSSGAGYQIKDAVMADPQLLGGKHTFWLVANDDIDTYVKTLSSDEPFVGRVSERQQLWISTLIEDGRIEKRFNSFFFSNGDSREPELAGIGGAAMGSILTLIVTLILAFPIGVAAAIYLEEFAPKNFWTDVIEVNINNLAAVPSIIFGLLGLAVFLNFFHIPRSVPLIGGLVLALMTLPTIIISSRAAIKSVPPSIREAAYGIGASKAQVVMHHVLPLAMPGMLTGTIIGMAQALGETAPLLMIGMVAFIVDIPQGFTDPSTVLPVQIFLWADSPERAFVEKTSAAIMVLLGFLVLMNSFAVFLRKKLERRW